jgi:hypothetical protein
MSDIRARLAAALRLNGDTCTRANADHLADVLLSLPGIAIVELPRNPELNDRWASFARRAPKQARALAAALLSTAERPIDTSEAPA